MQAATAMASSYGFQQAALRTAAFLRQEVQAADMCLT
jgi:hypothetical protein